MRPTLSPSFSPTRKRADLLRHCHCVQLREKLNAGQISTALDAGSKKKKVKKAATTSSSKRAASPTDSLDSSPPPAAKKGAGRRGKGKEKARKVTNFNPAAVSDVEDDDDLVNDLRKEAGKTKASAPAVDGDERDGMVDDDESSAAPSSSGSRGSGRKRAASASSDTSAPAQAAGDVVSEDDERVGAVSQAAKKRRVIVDSDED